MKSKKFAVLTAFGLAASVLALSAATAQSKTVITVFFGSTFRPDLMRPIFDRFQKANPTIEVKQELGGATSELQSQYLTTVLSAKDSSLDAFLIDVIRPAQYQSQGWLEPLDAYLGGSEKAKDFVSGYLPGPIKADTIDGKLWALPATTDTQFLYYRKDLLAKYNLTVPRTWEEVTSQAQTVLKGENNAQLQGLNFQGAPIEGAVCTFLQPFWAAGGEVLQNGKVNVNTEAGRKALNLWVNAINTSKISPLSMAESRTDDSRKVMQAGNAVFSLNWGYAWANFQGNGTDASKVKGLIGVAKLPTFAGSKAASANCQGGWQWGMSSFSKNKEATFKLIKYMSSSEAQAELSIKGGFIPVRKALYNTSSVLKANPHYTALYPVILRAKPRPVTANYPKVSEIIRTNVNAVVSGAKTTDQALKDMQSGLEAVLK